MGKLILLTIPGASFGHFNFYINQGYMPFLNKLSKRNKSGQLTFSSEINSWQQLTKLVNQPIWQIASEQNKDTALLGMRAPSEPVEINGVCLSNRYAWPIPVSGKPWTWESDLVFPELATDEFMELRVSASDIDSALLEFFAPNLKPEILDTEPRVEKLFQFLAETVTTHAAATHVVEKHEFELAIFDYPTIYRAVTDFGEYSESDNSENNVFCDVIKNAYCFLDKLIERIFSLLNDEDSLLIVGDPVENNTQDDGFYIAVGKMLEEQIESEDFAAKQVPDIIQQLLR